jgi:hypothetical protein
MGLAPNCPPLDRRISKVPEGHEGVSTDRKRALGEGSQATARPQEAEGKC